MAIYSCSHNPIGRTTHAAGTAGAHARYVTREGAAREILGEHMPTSREAARAWLDAQEEADRKNARVIDKVLVALPRELDAAERVQLVRDFAAEVTGGRTPWLAAIHDMGEDAGNPHAHIIIRDRDHETGKRSIGTSEKGSTDRIREQWERMANQALERAGLEARIDRRSLAAQGLDRQAGIHVGPNVLAMEERGVRPTSRLVMDGERVINWPGIDQGRTRLDRLAEIEAANDDREQERDRDRGKSGKGRGDPVPASTAPEPERDKVPVPAPVQEPRKQPAHEPEEIPPALVAPSKPEPIQRPSQEPERARETSRLRTALGRARERLEALGERLERAFDRFRNRTASRQEQQHQLDPLEEAKRRLAERQQQPGQDRSRGRGLLEDLERGRHMRGPGME